MSSVNKGLNPFSGGNQPGAPSTPTPYSSQDSQSNRQSTTLAAGLQNFTLTGADRFRFTSPGSSSKAQADRIIDFSRSQEDRIEISRGAFGLSAGATVSHQAVNSTAELNRVLGSATLLIQDLRDGSGRCIRPGGPGSQSASRRFHPARLSSTASSRWGKPGIKARGSWPQELMRARSSSAASKRVIETAGFAQRRAAR